MDEIKYSNSVDLQVQLFDAQLTFNLTKQSEVIDSTTIVLSPPHMKVLKNMLDNAVDAYEQQFGEIVVPQSEENKN